MDLRRVLAFGLGAAGAGWLAWRRASRSAVIPTPAWLGRIFEGSLPDALFRTQKTLDRIGLRPGQRVLEVGPGPGRLLIPAAGRVLPGGEVVGLDMQAGMVRRLMERARRAGTTNLSARVGDAVLQYFAPETFDVVYMVTVLGEIPDRHAALMQCYRVLKPGGRLSITEIFPDPHFQPLDTVKSLAQTAGFQFDGSEGGWNFFTANFSKELSGAA